MDLITSEDLNGQSMTTSPALPGHADANKNVSLSWLLLGINNCELVML